MCPIYSLHNILSFTGPLAGQTLVFTNGCFDLLHPGHVQYLTEAKALGDQLIVGINSDASVRELKGPKRPINHELFRATMVLALKPVDAVVIFEEMTPVALLEKIQPNIHVKGGDYNVTELPEYKTVTDYGGQVRCLSFLSGYSSTDIIQRVGEALH
ncbi:MAG: D-glycero-beta-D-manno-heptose 1-phosphate adenylyltransferase [Candidatus Marinamargulisbacteria bacterium]